MIKLYISPNYTGQDQGDGGIRRVIEAMYKYLPEFGIECVDNPNEADIINAHGAMPVDKFDKPIISTNHGLYWKGYDWGAWAHKANQLVIESMKRASAVTVPSHWVRNAITRGMLIDPKVIHHGINIEKFEPDPDPADWVLWNKARIDPISDPTPFNELARLMPDVRFVSTFGDERPNVKIIGNMPYEQMKKVIAKAGLYLATTRETFGIGTLEAMAYGVPVVGWAFGGQVEIIKQGETGYLVPEGDYEQLQKAIRLALENRDELGKNARQDVINRWQWRDKIKQYASIFHTVYLNENNRVRLREELNELLPKISVIITSYNLEKYLPNAIHSVLEQKFNDYELLVVDDCSTDSTWQIARSIQNENPDIKIQYLKPSKNLGLCGARNYGFQKAQGKYIIYLDADDMLVSNTLELLSNELDKDRSIHIAYGHLDLISDDGTNQRRNANGKGKDFFPPEQYSWRGQLSHLNQLPYAAMMRREVLENSGGYRVRDSRNEDASFWARMTSYGYVIKKVTQASTLIYRLRSDGKSVQEMKKFGKEPNWLAWLPFRFADTAKDGEKLSKKHNSELINDDIVPFGAQGLPPRSWSRYGRYWNVRHHQNPVLSVIIPVGPDHKDYVIDALDSLIAQDFQDWEVIVVNDTGKKWKRIQGAPYARIVTPKKKSPHAKGAGEARNAGVKAAKSGLIVFLDADDYLLPGALSIMYEAWKSTDGNCVIYGDWIVPKGDENPDYYKSYDFTCDINHDDVVLRRIVHSVTALYPRWAHDKIGGFNIEMPAWEDWDYQIKMYAHLGLCGVRIEQALLAYRPNTGLRRKFASYVEAKTENHDAIKAENDKLKRFLYNEHADYYKRRKPMACKKCPDNKIYNKALAELPQSDFEELVARNGGGMILEYHGQAAKIPVNGPSSRKKYYTKLTPDGVLIFDVHLEDAEILMRRTRKGVSLFTEWNPPQNKEVARNQPIITSATPKLPEQPIIDDDIWANVPVKSIREPVPEFKKIDDFRKWLKTNPDEEDLIVALTNERDGKKRKTVIKEINQVLNG